MNSRSKVVIGFLLALTLSAVLAYLLQGTTIAVLSPKGPVARHEMQLLMTVTLLMLVVVVPVFALTAFIAWKYRASNTRARYSPEWDRNRVAETVWWVIPVILIGVISVITWQSSHELDPSRPLTTTVKPITIQVVALQWKWLFIYPEQQIATVNYVQFPKNTPVNFVITSDAPMNSFWIPQLGGQIYAMSGMSTQLHLVADEIGNYRGTSVNLSGSGYAGMDFVAAASSQSDFDGWVATLKSLPTPLTLQEYDSLQQPSKNNSVASYSQIQPNLYDRVVMKYMYQ